MLIDGYVNGVRYAEGSCLQGIKGWRGQNTLDSTGFVTGPEQAGHAVGQRGFRKGSQSVDTPKQPDPAAGSHMIQVNTVGIAGSDGLGRGETTMLTTGDFFEFSCESF